MLTKHPTDIARKDDWATRKPSQEEIDTAKRVLRWLSDHATYFPEGYDAEERMSLAVAAHVCHVDVKTVRTT